MPPFRQLPEIQTFVRHLALGGFSKRQIHAGLRETFGKSYRDKELMEDIRQAKQTTKKPEIEKYINKKFRLIEASDPSRVELAMKDLKHKYFHRVVFQWVNGEGKLIFDEVTIATNERLSRKQIEDSAYETIQTTYLAFTKGRKAGSLNLLIRFKAEGMTRFERKTIKYVDTVTRKE